MSRSSFLRIGMGLVALLLAGLIVASAPTLAWYRLRYWDEVSAIEEAIQRVDKFRGEHGRLPMEAELLTTEGALFYKASGNTYVIGVNTNFDDYVQYDSGAREWSFEGRVVPSGRAIPQETLPGMTSR